MAVVKNEHICVVNAQVDHDLFRGCRPTINNHSDRGLDQGLQIARAHFDVLLSVVISKMLGRLRIRIVELGKALFGRIIGVVILDRVQKSNDTVDIVVSREALTRPGYCVFRGRA